MEQRISLITLGVGDLARSRAFYRALSWKESDASQDAIAFFQAGGMVFALFQRGALAEDIGVPDDGHGFPRFTLAYNVRSREEVDATLAFAVKAGARLVKPAEEVYWGGYSGYFADPDGFYWEVAHNPFCTINEKGEMVM